MNQSLSIMKTTMPSNKLEQFFEMTIEKGSIV